MRTLIILFSTLPIIGFGQSIQAILELQMFNLNKVVVCLDGKKSEVCSKFQLSGISEGDHKLEVYRAKQYINPYTQTKSQRLIPIYSCLLYTSPSPRDQRGSRMPSSA